MSNMAELDGIVDDGITPDAINDLRHEYDMGNKGWLSTLVWNTRNTYLSLPECSFSAKHVRMLVEGFMAEIDRLRHDLDEAQVRSIVARNPGIDEDEVRRIRARRVGDASSEGNP